MRDLVDRLGLSHHVVCSHSAAQSSRPSTAQMDISEGMKLYKHGREIGLGVQSGRSASV